MHLQRLLVLIVLCAVIPSMTLHAAGPKGTGLSTTQTATGHREYVNTWTIDKTVTPDKWDLLTGDSGTSQFTVTVTKTAGGDTCYVSGEVCVTNDGEVATKNLKIVDTVYYKTGFGSFRPLSGAWVNVDTSARPVLSPGETHYYPYKVVFAPVAGAAYRNTANVTITNHSGHLGTAFGPKASAGFSLPASPVVVNDSITVRDDNGTGYSFSDSGSFTYGATYTCDYEGENTNTATILETGQSASAKVTVNCYDIDVTKTAATSLTSKWNWTIEKSADKSSLDLSPGTSYLVNYTVKVAAMSSDSNFQAAGKITIHNNHPTRSAKIYQISDTVSPDIPADISLPDIVIAPNGTLQGDYTAILPDTASRTNTCIVAIQNYQFDSDGTPYPGGITKIKATADVDFANATVNKVDDRINVSDSFAGNLGTACDTDQPKTFSYPYLLYTYKYGEADFTNIASFVTDDTGVTGSSSWTVHVNVSSPSRPSGP